MKNIIFSLLMILGLGGSCYAQNESAPSTFHRLLVFNEANEMMIVRIANTDTWVTPGHYQNHSVHIRKGMDSIASTYGMTIAESTLGGIFTTKSGINQSISTRIMYVTKRRTADTIMPSIVEEVIWLPQKEAIAKIKFASTRALISQVLDNPETVWGGSLYAHKDEDGYKYELLENFYPLFLKY